jgi:SRSO17 transposase
VRDYVVEHLRSPQGVLIADDTQVIKQGDKPVGVSRQHCGLTGQVENCQVLPMLSYASELGHAFIDRRLYMPQAWVDDLERRTRAGVPSDLVFRTKPELVIEMLETAIRTVVHKWFAADSGSGYCAKSSSQFRDGLIRQAGHSKTTATIRRINTTHTCSTPLLGLHPNPENPS